MAVNFFFSGVHGLLRDLSLDISTSHHNMKWIEANGGADVPSIVSDPSRQEAENQAIASIKSNVKGSQELLAPLKCAHIDEAIKRLNYLAENQRKPFPWSEFNTRARALRDAIEVELREYIYYRYPKQKGEKFKSWLSDWEASLAAFPDIKHEVFSATDCYALQHNTASVFHSMRVAEYGLRALAKERRVKLPKNKSVEWGTWQEIIKALDEEIKLIGSTKKAGNAKDAALEFYSGARADLNGFKDEYRNLVMHVRSFYDEYQALRALTNVCAFMERISNKIDHKHHRIRWGLR